MKRNFTLFITLLLFMQFSASKAQESVFDTEKKWGKTLNIKKHQKSQKFNAKSVFDEGFEEWPPAEWNIVSLGEASGFTQTKTAAYSGEASAKHTDQKKDIIDWMVTPGILVPENGTLNFMEMNQYTSGYYEHHGVWISTEGNNPAEDNFTLLSEFDEVSADWTEQNISLSDYANQTVYIGFKYTGNDKDRWWLDDITVIQQSDCEFKLNALMTQGFVQLDQTAKFVAEVENIGIEDITDASIQITANGIDETKTFSISAGTTEMIEFDILPAEGENTYTATITYEADGEESNNVAVLDVRPVTKPIYGFRAASVPEKTKNFVMLDKENGEYIYPLSNTSVDESRAMCFVDGDLFVQTIQAGEAMMEPKAIGFIDIETGDMNVLNDAPGYMFFGMDYNPVDKKIYAVGYKANDLSAPLGLYNVDKTTGAITEVATNNSIATILTFTIDNKGNGYGINSTDGKLFAIDLSDFSHSTIGSTGLAPNLIQSMTYDVESNKLIWAYAANDGSGVVTKLMAVNTEDASVTEISDIPTTIIMGLTAPEVATPPTPASYAEGFNTWPPEGWTFFNDGDDTSEGWIEITTHFFEGEASMGHMDDDVNDDISTINWAISPAIVIPENADLTFYERNAYMTSYLDHSVMISTGSANPADGDFVLLKEMSENTDYEWAKATIGLEDYYGQQVYIAFRYTGDYTTKWFIDAFSVAPPASTDLLARELIVPEVMMITGEPINCTGVVFNSGNQPITGATATLSIGGVEMTENFDLGVGEEIEIDFDSWTGEMGEQAAILTVAVEGESNTDNNTAEALVHIHDQLSVDAYGYVTLTDDDEIPRGPAKYNIYYPTTIQPLDNHMENYTVAYGGAMIYHLWYCNFQELNDSKGAKGRVPDSYRLIDVNTGATIHCGPSTIMFDEMSYNYATDVLYGIAENKLYTVNPMNNEHVEIAGFGDKTIAAFAIHLDGTAYAIATDGNLYTVDLSNAVLTLVGATGVTDVQYIQSMAFDHNSGKLFWNLCNAASGIAYYVDHTTGAAIMINFLHDNAQVTCFDFPYGEEQYYVTFKTTLDEEIHPETPVTVNGITKITNEEGLITFLPFEKEESVSYSADFDGEIATGGIKVYNNGVITINVNSIGIEDLVENYFNIYPNPAVDFIQIEGVEEANIQIIDINGSCIKAATISSTDARINISDLNAGMYILKIQSEDHNVCTKLSIRK